MKIRRLVAAASLAMLAVLEFAPHRAGEASVELLADVIAATTQVQVIDCAQPNSPTGHLHPGAVREVAPCIACLREHVRITRAATAPLTPLFLAASAPVLARIIVVDPVHRASSSRAPPALAS